MAHTPESRARALAKMKARRRAWLLANGPCALCGSSDRLEVDHVDPNSKTDHKVWSWAEPRMLAELAKCQALCHQCHLEKTIKQLSTPLIHGLISSYMKHGCRCELCRATNIRKMVKWHAEHPRGKKLNALEGKVEEPTDCNPVHSRFDDDPALQVL